MLTNINNIPRELKLKKQWCVFKLQEPRKQGQHKSKIPLNPATGYGASSSDPSTWVDFETAVNSELLKDDKHGLGFFFNDDYIGLDIDDIQSEVENFIKNPNSTANLINWADGLTNHSYLECSQSGNGVHILFKGNIELHSNRYKNFEMYQHGRFFALTGDVLNNQTKIKEVPENQLYKLYASTVGKNEKNTPIPTVDEISSIPLEKNLSESAIINKMLYCRASHRIIKLFRGDISDYNSHSEADLALCNDLAFWCSKNPILMDSIFRKTGLYRDKWDEKHGAFTYGESTIGKAILSTKETYIKPTKNIKLNFNKSDDKPLFITDYSNLS